MGQRPGDPSRIWLIEDDMALVEVFPDQLALIDAKNVEKVREGGRWSMARRYPICRKRMIRCFLHQHILGWKGNGHNLETDHIDGNPLNNLESNLRIVTRSENQFNSGLRKDNTSGIKGVRWHERAQKWQVRITINGKESTGLFDSIDDAARARQEAEIRRPRL